VPRYPDP